MDLRTLIRVLRIEGLIPFTLCAILLGFAVVFSGPATADWSLFVIAAVAALLIHIDGHIWNDILDREIDRREKSRETGRNRPLILGWATVGEYRTMSAFVVAAVLVLSVYLTLFRPWTPLLVLLGFFFDYGYNHPRVALAHRPGTEWYIFPWLVVGVTVTVVYGATGLFSPLAFMLSLFQGLIATCFVVSMMRRDFRSDRIGGKITSSVRSPAVPHATRYGIIAMIIPVLFILPLSGILGNAGLAYLLVLVTSSCAGMITYLGARIDQLCVRALNTDFPEFEQDANMLVMQQVGLSVFYTLVMSSMVLLFGRIA